MQWLLLGARLALAGVLGVAGVAKLTDPGGTRSALAGFGVPATLTRAGAWCLPLVELALAALLLMRASAWTGAVAAFALDGRPVDLADYRGRDTLVVFWQPACPHCQRLAEDLRRWEAEPPLGKSFGARATPSAVLVDAEGRIASTVGVGARDVLALAGIVPLVVPPDARSPSA